MEAIPDELFGEIASYLRWPCTLAVSRDLYCRAGEDAPWRDRPVTGPVREGYPPGAPLKTLVVASHYHSMNPSADTEDALAASIEYHGAEVEVLRDQIALGIRRQQQINSDMAGLLRERLGYVVRGDLAMQEASALAHDRLWERNRDNVIALQTDRAELRRYQGILREEKRQMRLKRLFESNYLTSYSYFMGQ